VLRRSPASAGGPRHEAGPPPARLHDRHRGRHALRGGEARRPAPLLLVQQPGVRQVARRALVAHPGGRVRRLRHGRAGVRGPHQGLPPEVIRPGCAPPRAYDGRVKETATFRVKAGLAEMLKGGVIMDVVTADQARIAESAGAVAVMALERVPPDIRRSGGVARMSDPELIHQIIDAVTIPVMAKCRSGYFVEAPVSH